MIREIICWRCNCSKCNHLWTTKGNDLPNNCPKCHRVTWNDDYEPAVMQMPAYIPASQPLVIPDIPMNDAMAKFLAKQAAPQMVEPDQWAGWSEERSTIDHVAGETVYYREHLKTRKREEIRRETYFE